MILKDKFLVAGFFAATALSFWIFLQGTPQKPAAKAPAPKTAGPAAPADPIHSALPKTDTSQPSDPQNKSQSPAGLKPRLTCEDCRALADRGAFEESIKAYLAFIEVNQDHYQIDDAYHEVARIYDTKLFDFASAMPWYHKLMDDYPHSPLCQSARQRVDYLGKHSENGFAALAAFERIRLVEYARHREDPAALEALFEKLKAVLNDFPEAACAPEIRHWLASQYRSLDVDRAVAAYKDLYARHPGHPQAREGLIESGDALYRHGRYPDAIAAYRYALARLPGAGKLIQPQIKRSERNLLRIHLMRYAWGLVAVLVFGAIFLPKPGVPMRHWRPAMGAAILLFMVIGGYGCIVQKQFPSPQVLFALAAGFSALPAAGFILSGALAGKLLKATVKTGRPAPRHQLLAGLLLGVLFLLPGFYLIIYHVYPHYLVVFKL